MKSYIKKILAGVIVLISLLGILKTPEALAQNAPPRPDSDLLLSSIRQPANPDPNVTTWANQLGSLLAYYEYTAGEANSISNLILFLCPDNPTIPQRDLSYGARRSLCADAFMDTSPTGGIRNAMDPGMQSLVPSSLNKLDPYRLSSQIINFYTQTELDAICPNRPASASSIPLPDHSEDDRTVYAKSVQKWIYCRGDRGFNFAKETARTLAGYSETQRSQEFLRIQSQISGGNRDGLTDEQVAANIAAAREQANKAAAQDDRAYAEGDGGTCNFLSGFKLGGCLRSVLAWVIALVVWILSAILSWVAIIFDFSIKLSIYSFANIVNNQAFVESWKIIRDFCNLFYIFILLYYALRIIVGLDSFSVKTTLFPVIISALLINFSYPLTRVVIDVGNELAVFFYDSLGKNERGEVAISETIAASAGMIGVSGYNPESASESTTIGGYQDTYASTWDGIMAGIMNIIISFIMIFTFLYGAAIFVARTVVLSAVIIASPIGFFGSVFPAKVINDQAGRWKKELFSNTFVAPVFMVLLAIPMKIMSVGANGGLIPNNGQQLEIIGVSVGNLFFFIFVIFLINLVISASSSLGSFGAKEIQGKLGQWQKSTAGWVGRNTVGQAAFRLANTKVMRKYVAGTTGGRMLGGGLALKALDATGSAKFGGSQGYKDARSSSINNRKAADLRIATDQKTGKVDAEILERVANQRNSAVSRGINNVRRWTMTGGEPALTAAGATRDASNNEFLRQNYTRDSNGNWVAEPKAISDARKTAYSKALEIARIQHTIASRILAGDPNPTAGLAPVQAAQPGLPDLYTATDIQDFNNDFAGKAINEKVNDYDKLNGKLKNLEAKVIKEEEKSKP